MKWWLFLLVPLILGILWWLYENGYAWYQNKSAATFIVRSNSSSFGASFTGCTGTFGRCLKVREGGRFRFSLTGELSKGSVRGQIRRGKELLVELDLTQPEAVIPLEAGSRYRLELRFVRACGSCAIHWSKEDRR